MLTSILYAFYTLLIINFGDKIFGEMNFGESSPIHRISTEIRPLKIFGVINFRLGTSSPKFFHTEIDCK